MSFVELTKSYVNSHDAKYPVQEDLVLSQLFEKARDNGFVGELYNLESKERTTTIEILRKV